MYGFYKFAILEESISYALDYLKVGCRDGLGAAEHVGLLADRVGLLGDRVGLDLRGLTTFASHVAQ